MPRIEARDAGRTLCGVNREAAMGGRRRGGLGVLPSAVLARLEMVCVVGGEGERDEERRRASSGEVRVEGAAMEVVHRSHCPFSRLLARRRRA